MFLGIEVINFFIEDLKVDLFFPLSNTGENFRIHIPTTIKMDFPALPQMGEGTIVAISCPQNLKITESFFRGFNRP